MSVKDVIMITSMKVELHVLYVLIIGAVIAYLYLLKFNWSLLIYRPFLFRLKYNTNMGLVGYGLLLISRWIPLVVVLYYKITHKRTMFTRSFFYVYF